MPVPGRAPRIVLDGVGFRYGDEPVLEGFSLTLEPGTTTALVGPSGSGKTTVLNLVAGLATPDAGRLLIDGEDTGRWSAQARRAWSSVVLQHPYLFSGTVRENVRAGDPAADAETIAEALRRARVDEIAARLPDGLDSRVGDAGTALSGGERQRVSIARALVKPAPILLVDEATSALDTENEGAVVAALGGDDTLPESGGPGSGVRTRLIVAHRLSSIRTADRVVFLEAGRIVEQGTPAELRAAGGRFAQFWREQDAASRWGLGERGAASASG